MLVTIIPYFLLARVSDKLVWPNGPEYKFDSDVEIYVNGLKDDNLKHGFNITNKLTCRPKTDTYLHCQFQHEKMVAYEMNKQTGDIKSRVMLHSDSRTYDPFSFEIGFSKKGVKKVIINESLSKRVAVLDVVKAMASALNVASDLRGVKLSTYPVKLGQVQNIILDKCKGDVIGNLQPSFKKDSSIDADWNLELSPPLEKLAKYNFIVMKNWNMTDCKADKLMWLEMFMSIKYEDSPRGDDITVNLTNINDRITVSKESFKSLSAMNLKLYEKIDIQTEEQLDFHPKEKELDMQQLSRLRLREIQPAVDIWPEIENAVAIDLEQI